MATDRERDRDKGRLDDALEAVTGLMDRPVDGPPPEPGIILAAADRVVKLLERRAKLLGLDLAPQENNGAGESAISRMQREISERVTRAS